MRIFRGVYFAYIYQVGDCAELLVLVRFNSHTRCAFVLEGVWFGFFSSTVVRLRLVYCIWGGLYRMRGRDVLGLGSDYYVGIK